MQWILGHSWSKEPCRYLRRSLGGTLCIFRQINNLLHLRTLGRNQSQERELRVARPGLTKRGLPCVEILKLPISKIGIYRTLDSLYYALHYAECRSELCQDICSGKAFPRACREHSLTSNAEPA